MSYDPLTTAILLVDPYNDFLRACLSQCFTVKRRELAVD